LAAAEPTLALASDGIERNFCGTFAAQSRPPERFAGVAFRAPQRKAEAPWPAPCFSLDPQEGAMTRVLESFRRVRGDQLAQRFYDQFLNADSRFRVLFRNTDFRRQKELLLDGIFTLLKFASDSATAQLAIRRLAESHSRRKMGIVADMYPRWVDTLMNAVAELDPCFSYELEREWRAALQKGIDVMIKTA
jgi:hemoglobin-like flavoprotein